MNRRELLLATTGALASAASGSALGMSGTGLLPLIGGGTAAATVGASCALFPVQPAPRMYAGMREICMKRFFPSLVEGAGQLEQLTLDLQMLDDRSQLQTVLAWQLVRRHSASWSGGFRMSLPGQQVNLVVNLRRRGSRGTESWSGRLVVGVDSILATPRASTGRLPLVAELRLDADQRELRLADGSPRDFDALLLSAA
jgi:hypothetical protein